MKRTSFLAALLLVLSGFAVAQDKQPAPTAASLIEQGKFAEEQRDFVQAETIYALAAQAALTAQNPELASQAKDALGRVKLRIAGIAATPQSEDDPMICRLAERLDSIWHYDEKTARPALEAAYRDVALFGAIAVPWLEKAIQAPYTLCRYQLRSDPPRYIRALALMTGPEGSAALERQLTSNDPIARRAVAQYSDPVRHRAILLRALKDPAQAVREQAIQTLSNSFDADLFDAMLAAGREGSGSALDWIGMMRPAQLLQDAANPALSAGVRSRALAQLGAVGSFRPDVGAIDSLLSLARPPQTDSVRTMAMSTLAAGAVERWKPLDQDVARHIEDVILPALDSYPRPEALQVLMAVGGARSLVAIVEKVMFDDTGEELGAISRILARSTSADFLAVVAGFAKAPAPIRNIQNNATADQVHQMLRAWLETMVMQDISSADIARGATLLDSGSKRLYVERVVVPWIQAKMASGSSSAKLPAIDPSFVKLLREIAADGFQGYMSAAAMGFGATGDPKVLPDLLALVNEGGIDNYLPLAVKRITADDPARIRTLLELMLANKSITAQRFSETFRMMVGTRQPAELLALVNSLWSKANADRLMAFVAGCVPGPEGSAFLLAHYAELDPAASDTRVSMIVRFGTELYEPATEVIGAALRDPNRDVRQRAQGVFESFKQQQQIVDGFNDWMKTDKQSKQTVTELMQLLESSNPDVVIGAVKALAAMKARSSYPKLVGLLEKHKGDEAVKTAVMAAIDQLAQ
ncbi:MAG TPA: HEAT repeat domain-containing protein [Planctomycetota bacterium]|nr:HEAT repeat domain-containing protein [Planctomycetota bacterium]